MLFLEDYINIRKIHVAFIMSDMQNWEAWCDSWATTVVLLRSLVLWDVIHWQWV